MSSCQVATTFVRSAEDLHRRLAALDKYPDPDGRYRINTFCCHEDTWQATVVELMDRADVVLMDVRGATTQHRGYEFELQQLAMRMNPEQVVLVIDETTDRHMIEQALVTNGEGRLPRQLTVTRHAAREMDRLYSALLTAAYGEPVIPEGIESKHFMKMAE